MKLWILSDLHLDHGGERPEPPAGATVAVIAGDVCNDRYLASLAARLPTVFVAGNHEFYREGYYERVGRLSAIPHLHFLDDDTLTLNLCGHAPVRFIGATLWTDYGRSPLAAEAARRGMNDHRLIKWRKEPWERFLPSHATKLHDASRWYIEEKLATPFDGPTVVVTHHAPHEGSVHHRFAGQLLNHAYYSDLGPLIERGKPALWVHGHVHNVFDYTVGDTRVLCNPRGYPGENPEFNPELVVTV